MNYLTPSALKTLAPATQKLLKADQSLVDTSAFLRHMARLGYKPVFATQGTPHTDADTETTGRHLVVVGDDEGNAIALLNSHTIYRRAWMGAGFYWRADAEEPAFVLGAVIPLPRWRGFEKPLDALKSHASNMLEAWTAMGGWRPGAAEIRWLAKRYAVAAYLPAHKTADYKSLTGATNGTGRSIMVGMLGTVIRGGLTPTQSTGTPKKRRRLKPIKGPDALVQASNAAFLVGLAGLRKFKGQSFAFPAYQKT